jgi:protocatechuate 3,4-dioxygenase beta subunit
MRRVALTTVILGAIALTAQGQTARDDPSAPALQRRIINGRVLADDTGDPVPNARVTLMRPGPGATVLADRDGRFTLTALPGAVTMAASKPGFARSEVTATPAGQPIDIRLPRGAAISGRIVDARGDPLVAASITVEDAAKPLASRFSNAGSTASTFTDDHGEYRVGGLAAGTYLVGVVTMGMPLRQTMPGGGIAMLPQPVRTYYPGTETRDDGQALRLQPGEERSSTDFAVAPVPPFAGFMASRPLLPPRAETPQAAPAGLIRGRVVTTEGRGLPGAELLLIPMGRPGQSPGGPQSFGNARSDDDGRYEFREVGAGSFRIVAEKVGFSLPGSAMTPGLPPPTSGLAVDVGDGETKERVDVTLARWGSIGGHLLDELGDPLQGVSVQLLQVRYQNGRRRLVPAGAASRLTDDLGRFRVFGLAPGQYVVSAAAGDAASADVPGYARAYYPGTANASEAQFVRVGLGQDYTGVDFSLPRARTATISGTLLNAAGEPSTMGSVKLLPSQRSASVTSVPVGARLMKDGVFEFPNVTAGQYVIQVDRGRRNSSTEGEFGTLPVSVDGADVTGLVLQTSAGSSITGRVTFDTFNGATTPRPGQIDITPVPIDPDLSPASPGSADVHADWSFEIHGVNGPRRLQLQRAPSEWTLKEIRVNGIDVTDRPLAFGNANQSLSDVEVVLTDRINTVTGTIVDDHGRAAPTATVVVFSPDRDRWYPGSRYLRVASAGADGAILLTGLPAGSYYAAAVPALPPDGDDAWQDPGYLQSLVGRASAFALGEGQSHSLRLKLP